MSTGRKMRNQLIDASQKGPQFQTDLFYKVNVVFNFGLLNALGEQHDGPNNWCSGVVHFVMCSVQTGSRCRLQFLHYHRPVIQRIALERCWSVFLTRIRSVHRIRVGSVGRTGSNRQPLSLLRKNNANEKFQWKLPKRNFFLPNGSLLRPTSDYPLPTAVAVGATSTRAFVFLAPCAREMVRLVPVTTNTRIKISKSIQPGYKTTLLWIQITQ